MPKLILTKPIQVLQILRLLDDNNQPISATNLPVDNFKYDDNSAATLLGAPGALEGYKFEGWLYGGKYYRPGDPIEVMAELDINGDTQIEDIYPIFSVIEPENPRIPATANITFDGNGGNVSFDQIGYVASLSYDARPVVFVDDQGKKFKVKDSGNDRLLLRADGTTAYIISGDNTSGYTIKDTNGNTVTEADLNFKTAIKTHLQLNWGLAIPQDFMEREGYIFKGWSTDPNTQVVQFSSSQMTGGRSHRHTESYTGAGRRGQYLMPCGNLENIESQ